MRSFYTHIKTHLVAIKDDFCEGLTFPLRKPDSSSNFFSQGPYGTPDDHSKADGNQIKNKNYYSNTIEKIKVNGRRYEETNFNKCTIKDVTFMGCTFIDCWFQYATMENVEIHGCVFIRCNFYKCILTDVYANPRQFDHAFPKNISCANAAVVFYQRLASNYSETFERLYRNHAIFRFRYWKKRNDFYLSEKKVLSCFYYYEQLIYEYWYGYGYKSRRLLVSSIITFSIVVTFNNFYLSDNAIGFFKAAFETVMIISTLGVGIKNPTTPIGYIAIILTLISGAIVFSAIAKVIANRLGT